MIFHFQSTYTGFFNWDPSKNRKYGKKLKYQNWDPIKKFQVPAGKENSDTFWA